MDRATGFGPVGCGFPPTADPPQAGDLNLLIILNLIFPYAPIAQLDRASGFGPEGCGFDSCWAHMEVGDLILPGLN